MQIKDKRNRFRALKEELSEYRFGVCSGLKDPDYDIVSKSISEAEKMLDLCEATREKARAAELVEAKPEQHTTAQV
jgi:hypothetical protein